MHQWIAHEFFHWTPSVKSSVKERRADNDMLRIIDSVDGNHDYETWYHVGHGYATDNSPE